MKEDPIAAVKDLIQRVLPRHAQLFVLELIPQWQNVGSDVFEIDSNANKTRVILRGNNGIALSSALNYYLKYLAHCQISWGANNLNIPEPAPMPTGTKIKVVTPYKYRYYMNTCTHGYSAVWWHWKRWEQEIDWMALNGIKNPLMFTGQEYIWREVYKQLGVSDLRHFFTGPAFLPWNRMANVDGYMGPLPDSWIKAQFELALLILKRMRSLGMAPILPAFAGHVPASLKSIYPNAKIEQLASWCGFNGTYYLDPLDPLFVTIGAQFIRTMNKYFGTDHLYNADPFNEETPPTDDPSYLSNVGKMITESMTNADPDAVWVMQGWFLYYGREFWKPPQAAALLKAIPQDKLIILDLFSEVNPVWNTTDIFYEHVFVWNMLHNFGGRPGLYGALPIVAHDPFYVMERSQGFMQGIGLTMEAIEQNPVAYDLVTDMIWRNTTFNLDQWIRDYAHRRYGQRLPEAELAWKYLKDSVYTCYTKQHGPSPIIVGIFPTLKHNITSWYNPLDLIAAWNHLLSCSDALQHLDTYKYDVVTVTVQALAYYSLEMYYKFVSAFLNNDKLQFKHWSDMFMSAANDIENILASNQNFLLGKWINFARQWGTTLDEKFYMEINARTQITTWAPPNIAHLNDYAYKLWSGLVQDYQARRWSMFISALSEALDSGKPFDNDKFIKEVLNFEWQWTHSNNPYPITPRGNTIDIAKQLFEKYRNF